MKCKFPDHQFSILISPFIVDLITFNFSDEMRNMWKRSKPSSHHDGNFLLLVNWFSRTHQKSFIISHFSPRSKEKKKSLDAKLHVIHISPSAAIQCCWIWIELWCCFACTRTASRLSYRWESAAALQFQISHCLAHLSAAILHHNPNVSCCLIRICSYTSAIYLR